MRRKAIDKLIEWKNDPNRKPLILRGARQVGKTWLMKEFGAKYYDNYVYFNFDENIKLKEIFERTKEAKKIIELLSLIANDKISPAKTLIILDEIQECPEALNSLKYFKENAREYHVISAGSLLGTLLAKAKSYPVGMVNIIDINPLTFDEFLEATDPGLYNYYISLDKNSIIDEIFHDKLIDAYNYYLIIGGMPECVYSWINDKEPKKIATIQDELIKLYENDFAKHNGNIDAARILLVFRSIVSQLAKSNEKFIYGSIKKSARAREFETAIEWLVSAGIVNRIYNVSKVEHPIKAYDQLEHFKLFVFDTGLLKAMAGIDNEMILLNSDFQFKGPLTENYILQQLKGQFPIEPRYYSTTKFELDFILQNGSNIVPIEVKGGQDKASTSFKKYVNSVCPKDAVRFSKRNYKKDGGFTNIPLYLAAKLNEYIK